MAKNFDFSITSNKGEYQKAIEEVAEKVLTMWGMEAESAAKKRAPVDTGLLRNSITYAIAGGMPAQTTYKADKGDGAGSYTGQAQEDRNGPRHVYIGTNVEYAMAQEVGSFKDGPHAFLRPAIEENKDHFREILEGELKGS